jgi:type IV secretory pathway TrbD component
LGVEKWVVFGVKIWLFLMIFSKKIAQKNLKNLIFLVQGGLKIKGKFGLKIDDFFSNFFDG